MNENEFQLDETTQQEILDEVKVEFPEFHKQEVLQIVQGSLEFLQNEQDLSHKTLRHEVKCRCLWVRTYLELRNLLTPLSRKYRVDVERMDEYVYEAAWILLTAIREGIIKNSNPLSYARGIIYYLILKGSKVKIVELTEQLSTMEKIEIETDIEVMYHHKRLSGCMEALQEDNPNRYRLFVMHHAYSFSLKEMIAFWGEDFLRHLGFLDPKESGELLELSDLEKARLMLENKGINQPEQEYISFLEENLFNPGSEALLIILEWLRQIFPTWRMEAVQDMQQYRLALLKEALLLVPPQQEYQASIGAIVSNYNSTLTTTLENRFKNRINQGKKFLYNCLNQ